MEKIKNDYMEIHRKSFAEEQTMDAKKLKIELHQIRNKITAQENRVKNKLYTDVVSRRVF